MDEYLVKGKRCFSCGAVKVPLYVLLDGVSGHYYCSCCFDVAYRKLKRKSGGIL